jgi:hypothetical protein
VSNRVLYRSTRTQSIANIVENRALAYAGKVARMHAGRVQQQLLFGWVPTYRPKTSPKKTIASHYHDIILERARKLKNAKDRAAFYSRRIRTNSTKPLMPKPWDDARLWVMAAQDERLWQRLINIANHRHIKTSKGWIDIAYAPHVCARPPQTPTNNNSQPKTTATTATPSNPNIIIYNTDPNVAPDDPNDWYQLGSGEFGDHPGNI